jgi:UDP-N-acetylglucosamine---dolichyl-phosphate N-acetylglucosaminyltransferase
MEDICIVIPAYNEERSIGRVLSGLKQKGYRSIIVVDDGSSDRTSAIASRLGASVYRHPVNRGLGGALGTGIEAGLRQGAKVIVTFDAEGQHDPEDIKRMVKPILSGKADAVIGSRLVNPQGMPVIRRIGNWGFNIITLMLFGVWTTDSQSGLRAFSRKAAARIEIRSNRMEVSSEIIKEIGAKRIRFTEVPIKAIYTDYSLAHGQSNLNALRILGKLVLRKMMR